MSQVHNVVLVLGAQDWRGDGDNAGGGVDQLQAWLRACPTCSTQRLDEISRHANGGQKALEVELWAAGINYLDVDGFEAAFRAITWNDPSEVSLIIAPDEGPHRVLRGSGA